MKILHYCQTAFLKVHSSFTIRNRNHLWKNNVIVQDKVPMLNADVVLDLYFNHNTYSSRQQQYKPTHQNYRDTATTRTLAPAATVLKLRATEIPMLWSR